MIQPAAFSEHILYQTIRIECCGNCGTGFIFGIKVGDNRYIPIILTNKHVVDNLERNTVDFWLHTKGPDNTVLQTIVRYNWDCEWIFHPDEEIDLCCCLFMPMVEEAKRNGIEVFFSTCTEELLADEDELSEMQTVNDILMVGYPNGLYDTHSFLPLIRKGITASHPATDFGGESIGVIDIGCFEGSSGSPIYTYPGMYDYRKTSGFTIGATKSVLLGVFFGGAYENVEGVVCARKPQPNKYKTRTEIWLNLGYYVKAKEILTLKPFVLEKCNITPDY